MASPVLLWSGHLRIDLGGMVKSMRVMEMEMEEMKQVREVKFVDGKC